MCVTGKCSARLRKVTPCQNVVYPPGQDPRLCTLHGLQRAETLGNNTPPSYTNYLGHAGSRTLYAHAVLKPSWDPVTTLMTPCSHFYRLVSMQKSGRSKTSKLPSGRPRRWTAESVRFASLWLDPIHSGSSPVGTRSSLLRNFL